MFLRVNACGVQWRPRMRKEIITVTVQAARSSMVWVYRKPDSNWTILKTDKGKCLGVVDFEPNDGDRLKIEGQWKKSDYSGEMEFHFRSAMLDVPTDSKALLHYACSITKGLGPSKEQAIWEQFGEDWREHYILTGIKGITETIHWNWKDTLDRLGEQEEQTQAIAFLLSHSCGLNMANAAWKLWGKQAVGRVEHDPYELTKLPYYGFGDIDNGIRQTFGIKDNDPRRLRAAILYAVGQIVSGGNTIIDWDETVESVSELVPDCKNRFEDEINNLVEVNQLRILPDELGLVLMLCREKDFQDESAIWNTFSVPIKSYNKKGGAS